MACHCDYCESGFGSYCTTEEIAKLKAELTAMESFANGCAARENALIEENKRLREALEEIDMIHVSDTLNPRKWEKAYFRFKKIAKAALEGEHDNRG